MKILGLNFSFDSAAALIEDGRVVAASQEERFSRVKHDSGFPLKAMNFCLYNGGTSIEELDAIAFFWNPGIHAKSPTRRFTAQPRHHLEYLYNLPANLLGGIEADVDRIDQVLHLSSGRRLNIHYITHHLCHAACAFYTSPFEEAAILTVDGYGERQSTLIARGRGENIEPLLSVEFPHSVGSLYAAVTQYLGFRPNSGEGKVMGLASYGHPGEYLDAMRELVNLTDEGFEIDLRPFEYFRDAPRRYNEKFIRLFGPEREPESLLEQRHMDIAYALQKVTEEIILHLTAIAAERTGSKNLCMAGGVTLNCVANGRIVRDSGLDRFFFYPAASDAGSSVGAALWASHNIYDIKRSGEVACEYLGPEFDREAIMAELKKARLECIEIGNPERLAARMIADGMIIGWFQGRSEFGPRSLGNRSILADPRHAEMKDLLNSTVKFRESFRPYAPSVLAEACGEYFASSVPSPHMLRSCITRKDKLEVLPAVTHVDGTARIQTVREKDNPRFYKLIREFGELTGVPVVLNTSFNIRGEPIVHTIQEALKCLAATGLDAVFVGDFLIPKDPEKMRSYLDSSLEKGQDADIPSVPAT